jgi:hypothetical protein
MILRAYYLTAVVLDRIGGTALAVLAAVDRAVRGGRR